MCSAVLFYFIPSHSLFATLNLHKIKAGDIKSLLLRTRILEPKRHKYTLLYGSMTCTIKGPKKNSVGEAFFNLEVGTSRTSIGEGRDAREVLVTPPSAFNNLGSDCGCMPHTEFPPLITPVTHDDIANIPNCLVLCVSSTFMTGVRDETTKRWQLGST